MQQEFPTNQVVHAILTCYDNRIDNLVTEEAEKIRKEGGYLPEKNIFRPPGGVHLLAGKDCREAFYRMLSGLHTIAQVQVLHLWPHTNCQYCGIHHGEKLGNGSQSDLRFHLTSAEKMLDGAMNYFSGATSVPEFDSRVILTIDQRIVTIEEAHQLLPLVPAGSHHGSPCMVGHRHSPGNGHHLQQGHGLPT